MTTDSTDGPRLEVLVSLLGLLVLGYIGGALSGVFQVFPYPQLLKPYFATLASTDEQGVTVPGTPTSPRPWQSTWYSSFGVVHNSSDPAPGATLYTSGHRPQAVLVDADGRRLHTWQLSYDEAWGSSPPRAGRPDDPDRMYWRAVHLLDDGGLLAQYTAPDAAPQGFGLVRLDRDSELVWRYPGRIHRDLEVGPDSEIVALAHRFRDTDADPVDGMPQLPDRVLADQIVRLSPDGDELQRISLLEAFADSPYLGALQMYPTTLESPGEPEWDALHASSVARLDPDFADHHAFAEPGHLLVTLRTLDLVAVVDPDAREVVWATRGAWWQPTDATPLPDGDMLVYDSNGHGGEGLASRILRFDPATERVSRSYTGTEDEPFWSREGGTLQPLPDGHVLFTSPLTGQIKEIDADDELIWEYRNPAHRRHDGRRQIAVVWDAERIPPDRLDWLPASPR